MHSITSPRAQLLVGGTACLATCWSITRTDGQTLRFTDHEVALQVEGQTYTPGGYAASARVHVEGVSSKNFEARGYVDSDEITEDDLRAGRYWGATVTELLVDWRFPDAGVINSFSYEIEETTWDGEHWRAEIAGFGIRLLAQIGHLYTQTCRWQSYGDSDCGKDLTGETFASSVSAVTTIRRAFETPLGNPDRFFALGKVVWLTGDNAGLESGVRSYLATDGVVTLRVPTPFNIQVGDTFNIIRGCGRQFTDCEDRGNVPNFGGLNFMPGDRAMIARP